MSLSLVGHQIGQYHVLDRLGHGGMGTVYRALDEMLDREVALKVLGADLDDPQERFRVEAVTLARLAHPGIATVHELFLHEGNWVMVMEFVRGETLEQIIEQGVLTPERAAELCMKALTALAYAHAAGVVHRDLKPSNLMLTADGTVKVLDFGIARVEGAVHLTDAGFMVGTPAYMAPEQVTDEHVDERADLYALGVIFYRLVTGQLPFRGETALAMAQSQVHTPPTPIHALRSDVAPWVHDIADRALAKAPGDRFQSAAEFHDAFACCLRGLPLPTPYRADGATEVVRRPSPSGSGGRSRTLPSLLRSPQAALWVGLAAAGIFMGVWRGGAQDLRTPDAAAARPQSPPAPAPAPAPPPARASARAPAPAPALRVGRGERPAAPAATRRASSSNPVVTSRASREVRDGAAVPAIFRDVKLLLVNGRRTTSLDVLLTLSHDQMLAAPSGGSAPVAAVPYDRIAKASYVYAKDPQWDPRLSAPAEAIDVPGILGRWHHWLVVQTNDMYTILQLSGNDWRTVLKILTDRSGVTVDQPATINN